jgi:hypothetical protein
MELLNFTTENLHQSKSDYTFEDVQLKISNNLTTTIEGTIEIEFDSEQGLTNPDNLDYFIKYSEITIDTIMESDFDRLNLSDMFTSELKQIIKDELNTLTIESH